MTAVLFATEYDTSNIVLNILAKTPTDHDLFPLIVKHKASPRVDFYLQTQKCNDSKRLSLVMTCRADSLDLSNYLLNGKPIPATIVSESIDDGFTRPVYDHLFTSSSPGEGADEAFEFRHLVYFHRNAVLRYLNTNFLSPTSPSWFMSTFGATDGMLLLSMSYYLFEGQYSTVQTTRDYVRCFTADTGTPILTYVSMREFMRLMIMSPFRSKIPQFTLYAKTRNSRDRRELTYIDDQINTFRRESRLQDAPCVHYVYLAYRTALSRSRFLHYCELTAYDPSRSRDDQCTKDDLYLGTSLADDLISLMDKYFSLEGFFKDYVYKQFVSVDDNFRCIGYSIDPDADRTAGFFGQSHALSQALTRLNDATEGLFTPVSCNLSGLLNVCASEKTVRVLSSDAEPVHDTPSEKRTKTDTDIAEYSEITRREFFISSGRDNGVSGPIPAFRIELAGGRHVFCAITHDRWKKTLFRGDVFGYVPMQHLSDESLTDAICLRDELLASSDPRKQLYLCRHEIFNTRLPVFNFIGDVDLKLKGDGATLTRDLFFRICRGIRNAVIKLWTHLFGDDIDEATYPVYFFKTACRPQNMSNGSEQAYDEHDAIDTDELSAFCSCSEKIGMRVIAPFPPGTAAIDSNTLKTLASMLDHVICLDTALASDLNTISHPGELFDTAIYRHGASVRVPYMYKIDKESYHVMFGRLNPVFIVPPGCRDNPSKFVTDQMSIENLLHHASKTPIATRIMIKLKDLARSDASTSFIDSRSAKVSRYPRPALGRLIQRYVSDPDATEPQNESCDIDGVTNTDPDDSDAVCASTVRTFVTDFVWPVILRQVTTHYDEYTSSQFVDSPVVFDVLNMGCVAVKNLQHGRLRDFRCLNRRHRNAQETVQVFIDLRSGYGGIIWATLWSRCFARKCNSNAKYVHVSARLVKRDR